MLEAIVHPLPELTTEIHEVPIPAPAPDQVVIKVIVAGSNPKDWDHLTSRNISANSGDDVAGTIYEVGENVKRSGEFHVGDRVAAFHPMFSPGGAYAEYALAPQHTTFKIPDQTSFEEAATIPLVTMTAALSLYQNQHLPTPWFPRSSSAPKTPLIIYGASSALGSFAIKLAKLSNIHPIIAICGGSQEYVASILEPSKGDTIVDYRNGVDTMKAAVEKAAGEAPILHALDAITSKGTWIPISQMLSPGGQLSVVSGANTYDDAGIPGVVEIKYTYVGTVHSGAYIPTMPKQPEDKETVKSAPDFAYVLFRYISHMLAQAKFEGHPCKVIPGGLGGVAHGLQELKTGNSKGFKFVYRIEETEGIKEKQ